MKKSDSSKANREAAKWRRFDRIVREVRKSFADIPPKKLQKIIDEAVRQVRAERRAKMKAAVSMAARPKAPHR